MPAQHTVSMGTRAGAMAEAGGAAGAGAAVVCVRDSPQDGRWEDECACAPGARAQSAAAARFSAAQA